MLPLITGKPIGEFLGTLDCKDKVEEKGLLRFKNLCPRRSPGMLVLLNELGTKLKIGIIVKI